MNKQNSMASAKLISHVLIDFSSEAEMELFINYVERTGTNFYEIYISKNSFSTLNLPSLLLDCLIKIFV